MDIDKTDLNKLVACPECDIVSSIPELEDGFELVCVRCGASVFERKKDSINRTLAISLAGVLLIIPSYFTNLIGIETAGLSNEVTLFDCIDVLIEGDFYLVAMLVFLFTVAFPVVRLFATFYLTFRIKFNKISPSLTAFYRSFHLLDSWSFLNIFFFGLIVSMYKLFERANLIVEVGFIAFMFLLLCSILISVTLDHDLIWHELEQRNEG